MSDVAAPTLSDVEAARQRITPYINSTPLMTCSSLDALVNRKLYFKCENFQTTGSFKARGAMNAVLQLKAKNPDAPGVVTHSSGNHGQALAHAASVVGLPCSVVTPRDTPLNKRRAMEQLGAEVVLCEPNPTARAEACSAIEQETGKVFISTCENPDVVAGQGSMVLEMLDEVPDLDALVTTMSGGGLAGGCSIALKARRPQAKFFIVEPQGKNLEPCLRSGQRLWPNPPQFVDTIMDGCRVQQAGRTIFPVLCNNAEKDVLTVTDKDVVAAMKMIFNRMKLVVEPSAAGALAGVLTERFRQVDPSVQKVGVVLCGGNVDVDHLPWMDGPV